MTWKTWGWIMLVVLVVVIPPLTGATPIPLV